MSGLCRRTSFVLSVVFVVMVCLSCTQSTAAPGGPVLDPDRELSGIGFRQRRAAAMNPEDPRVLEWLKRVQDNATPDKLLLSSTEGDDEAQTFNNALAAMAFIIKGERERAERILGFYARATAKENVDSTLQNFFLRGEARGFYQHVSLRTYHDGQRTSDRWIGDMAWLLLAYTYYEKEYHSDRYAVVSALLKDLLKSYYIDAPGGGYIRHGWRKGDTYLHEPGGHHEGNIDCYAVMKVCGEDTLAKRIRGWIDRALDPLTDLPLDLYTWRVLAYGRDSAALLNVAEYDLRYRKTLQLHDKRVVGFYHGADIQQQNIWVDGTGHMACAFLTCGDKQRGYFYANQLDSMLIEGSVYSGGTRTLPYTANKSGGYAWTDPTKGFTSCAAWYILAKNGFNPLRLEKCTDH